MINVTELKRNVIDEFLTSQPLVTNTPFKSVAKIYTGESTNAEEKTSILLKLMIVIHTYQRKTFP